MLLAGLDMFSSTSILSSTILHQRIPQHAAPNQPCSHQDPSTASTANKSEPTQAMSKSPILQHNRKAVLGNIPHHLYTTQS